MKSFFASFSQPGMHAVDATLLIFDERLSIGYKDAEGVNQMVSWDITDLDAQFLPSLQQTRIRNSKFPGKELLVEGKDAEAYIRSLHEERQKPWHQRSRGREWIRNTVLLLAILASLFLMYLLIVPWLSSRLASRVSIQTERQLGDAVYDAMGLAGQEDSSASYILNEFFAAMDVPTPYEIRITVINDQVVNAFALPGGRIVVFSALLKQLRSYPELAALLSHEFIHIHNKHATRSIFRRLGSKVFIGLLFGRFGNVAAVLADHADNIKSLSYSRRLEKEADMEGLAILVQRNIDPAGFIQLLETLESAAPPGRLPEMLASHPNISTRTRYIKEQSGQKNFADDPHLHSIFEKLKY